MGEISIARRITMLIVAAVMAVMLSFGLMNTVVSTSADAAPKCPGGTTAVKGDEPGEFECVTTEPQKNPKFTETQEESFKGAPAARKSTGEEETQCENPGGNVKEGPCPGGQEPA